MKKIFYTGLTGIALFEFLNVYFIMPMPGSQTINSLDLAYFLYSYRWYFRVFFGLMVLAGSTAILGGRRRWIPGLAFAVVLAIIYLLNFRMSADRMFERPANPEFKGKRNHVLEDSSLVVGVSINGETKAYPVRYIVYHHQVPDTVGGKPVLVTYCSVCRTGRVYDPVVDGHLQKFRLVGMDHFNAMFEDATTRSWWRQATGEAVTGPLKGKMLGEIESFQISIGKLFELYPGARVMQSDKGSEDKYDSLAAFEYGRSKSELTRTDSSSWQNKSWIVGVQAGKFSKAYDWNRLKSERCLNDRIGFTPVVIVVSADDQSFFAFERPSEPDLFRIRNDTLFGGGKVYDFSGRELALPFSRLKRVRAYQEFWHSWQTFHPSTMK